MLLQRPFEAITPTLDGTVLHTLAGARTVFSIAEILRLNPEHSRTGIKKVLDRLVDQGNVRLHRIGSVSGYSLNREHLLAEAVVAISTTKKRFIEHLRDEINGWGHPPTYAALFGSAARGDMRVASDVDILIVGSAPSRHIPGTIGFMEDSMLWDEQLVTLSEHVTLWTGNPAQIVEMTDSEAATKHLANDPFLRNVVLEGIVLGGQANYLTRANRGQDATQ